MKKHDFQGDIHNYDSYSLASNFLLALLNSKNPIKAPENIDWAVLLNLMVYHRFTFIAKEKILNIPADYKSKFNLINKSIINKNKRFFKLLDQISLEFNNENIDFLPIKGASKLNINRKMDDIDILIHKEDLEKIKTVLSKFMSFSRKAVLLDLFHESRARSKDNLLVEFKYLLYTPKHISLSYLQSTHLKKELLFCFEAHHAIFHNSFQKAILYYDGYLKLNKEKFDYASLFEAAKISGTLNELKSYIYVIHKLFNSYLPKSYYSKKDLNRAELFFKLNHPLSINTMYDAFVLESIIRVSHSKNIWDKMGNFFSNFIKNRLFFDSKKNRIWFFFNALKNPLSKKLTSLLLTPNYFYRWLDTKSYLWANSVHRKIKKRHVGISFYVFYQMDRFDGYLDLFRLLNLSYSPNLKSNNKEALIIIEKKEVDEWIRIGKKYHKENIVRAWLYELKMLSDKQSKKWNDYYGFNPKLKREERLLINRRKIVLRDYFGLKLFYFYVAIFPSLSRAKVKTRVNLLKEWVFNLSQVRTNIILFISMFKRIK